MPKKETKGRKKLITLPRLKKQAWSLMSIFVRKLNLDHRDWAICYTCGIKAPWKTMHASHFIHNKLDFDIRNIKPSCPQCNTFKHGNLGVYAYKLIKDNGLEWVERLQKDARKKGNNYSREELESIIKNLKKEL